MVKQIYFCDSCGGEIKDNFYRMEVKQATKDGQTIEEVVTYDLCIGCFQKWTEQFQKRVDDESQIMADEARAKLKRKEIDAGKINALRRAGWQVQTIASEMGISIPTVKKYLKEEEDGKG